MWKIGKFRIGFGFGKLPTNYHGPKGTTLRRTFLVCRCGDSGYISRRGVGVRIYFYGATGACVNFDFLARKYY